MDKKYRKYLWIVYVVLLFVFIGSEAVAQCPMCRMAAETNLANGGTEGRGLNTGILYMLSLPYLLIGTIAYLWLKNRRKGKEEKTPYKEN